MGVANVVNIVAVKVQVSAAVAILDPDTLARRMAERHGVETDWRRNTTGVALDQIATVLPDAGFGPLGPARRRVHVAFTSSRWDGSFLGHGGYS